MNATEGIFGKLMPTLWLKVMGKSICKTDLITWNIRTQKDTNLHNKISSKVYKFMYPEGSTIHIIIWH